MPIDMRRKAILAAAVALAVAGCEGPTTPPPASIRPSFDVVLGEAVRITDAGADQLLPRLSGEWLVWEDRSPANTGTQVRAYDLRSGTRGLVSPEGGQFPNASSDRIVFQDEHSVVLHQPSTGSTTYLTPTPPNHLRPEISGDRIAYAVQLPAPDGSWDLAMLDLRTGVETLIVQAPGDQREVAISGDLVAWQDSRNGNWDIYALDLTDGVEVQITTDPADDIDPDVSGDRVVWTKAAGPPEAPSSNLDVYMYDRSTGLTTVVTDASRSQFTPTISGDIVVWSDTRVFGNLDVYMLDLSTGEEVRVTSDPMLELNPDIFGSRIAWQGRPVGESAFQIFMRAFETGPSPCLDALRALIDEMVVDGRIDNLGIAQSLKARVDQAKAKLTAGNVNAMSNGLNAFVRHVEAQSGRHIDREAAAHLIELALAIVADPC